MSSTSNFRSYTTIRRHTDASFIVPLSTLGSCTGTFGNHTTSRLEGAQAALKRSLQNSKCYVVTFIRGLEDYDNEMSNMRILATILFAVNGFLAPVIVIVTPYVQKQHPELKTARGMVADPRTITPCTSSFSSVSAFSLSPQAL
jgi:hypothetical protein